MRSTFSLGNCLSSRLASAAHFFNRPKAWITGRPQRWRSTPMTKLRRERSVCAPHRCSVDYKDVNKFIYAGHFLTSIFELEIEGRKERVLPRDYQLDVVTDRPVHVDFLRLLPGSHVRIGIPVHVANREASPGLKKGGAVNLVLHTVEVMAPADDIPESITIDLAGMDFHDSVHVSALKLPEGCRPISGTAELTVV